LTASTTTSAGAPSRSTPWAGITRPVLRRRTAEVEHAAWCVHHGPAGCEGQIFSLPGTQLLVWLSAPSAGDARLVVEGPDGISQLPVSA
jgi:hypothetical protein